MPLPETNIVFPPKALIPGYQAMREHAAWWAGDVDELRAIYGGMGDATHVHQGRPMRGGVAGFFSRVWWGRRLASGEERTALHIPVAANLATLSSDLLNAEPAVFGVAGDRDKATRDATEERLDLMWNSPRAHVTQNETGELTAALGGTYWVADWNTNGPLDYVFARSVDADAAVPTFRGGDLVEVTFWTRIDDGRKVYRHLEHHEPGAIIHALYLSDDPTRIGYRVPLESRPETAHLASVPGAVHLPDMTVIPTYIDRLTAVYEPNIRRSRKLRKAGPLADWGRSDFEGNEGMLNSFDETWSSWMRDLKVGRARLLVPEAYLETKGPGSGASFDAEREVYAALNMLPNKDGKTIEAHQFEIRVEQHERTAFNLKKEILQATGYSLSSYGEHVEGEAITATEVTDRKSSTERTRDKKIRYATEARTKIASVQLELDGLIFRGRGGRPGVEVVAEFPAESQIDPEKEMRMIALLDAASAITTETKVRRANPEWDDERVGREVRGIQRERGLPAPDPAEITV